VTSELAARGSSAADAGSVRSGAVDGAQAAVDLASVLQQLSQIEALSANFREEKRMALLAQPLISEGSLHYERPRKLARHSERPRASSMVLSGDVLTFGDRQRSESIGLSSQPALRVLVDTFVSVLAGDRAALERVAEVSLEPTSSGYRIRVVPKDAGVKRLVQSMTFEGQGALLSRMEVLDATGDRTSTTFSRVTLRKRFSETERSRLFRIGG
jgi:outer membrane lipoprotein-sorting protein